MQSERTGARLPISQEERESLHRTIAASNAEVKEVSEEVEGELVNITIVPHALYISERRRLRREREKAYIGALREARKKHKARAAKAKRRAKAMAKPR